jgi:hypothetical protein
MRLNGVLYVPFNHSDNLAVQQPAVVTSSPIDLSCPPCSAFRSGTFYVVLSLFSYFKQSRQTGIHILTFRMLIFMLLTALICKK